MAPRKQDPQGSNPSGQALPGLIRRLQQVAKTGGPELLGLVDAVVHHPSATPAQLAWMLSANHPKVREAGRDAIATAGAEAVTILTDAMANRDRTVVAELAQQLLRLDRAVLQPALQRFLQDRAAERRRIVLDVINAAAEQTGEWLGHLKRLIKDPDTDNRSTAVRLLCRGAQDERVRMILLHLVHEDEPRVRLPVLHALCRQPSVDLIEPLFARLPHEQAEDRRLIVDTLGQLASHSGSQVESKLVPFLADEDPEMRTVAVKLLIKLPNASQVLKTFLLQSRGLAPWLRERATEALLDHANQLVEPLIDLMRDQDVDVRTGAMMLASRVDDPRVRPAVLEILAGTDDWWIRSMAADILARFSDVQSVEALLAQLGDEDLQYSILAALGAVRQPTAVPPLLQALADPSAGIRRTVVTALANYPGEETAKALCRAAVQDADAQVRTNALQTLREFGPKARKMVEAVEQQRTARQQAIKGAPLELEMASSALNQQRPKPPGPPGLS